MLALAESKPKLGTNNECSFRDNDNARRLEKYTLGLLLVELDVFDNEHPDQRESHDSSTADDHVLLRKRIRLLNCKTCRSALGEAELHVQIFVDAFPIRKRFLRQKPLQSARERALPDRPTYGTTHRSANITEHTKERERPSSVLVIRSRENGDLLHDDHSAARERQENLTHDQVAHALIGFAEEDHEALTQHVQRHSPVQHPPEAARFLDGEAHHEEPHARHDVEDGRDVAGYLEGLPAVDLQERGEVRDPAVVGDLVAHVECARAHHGARAEDVPLEEGYGC